MRKTSLVFMICLFCASAFSQVSLTGPECAMPGLSYQYLISGKWDSSSKMHVCVTGGAIAGGSTCTADGPPLSSVVVIWNEKATGGTITVTSTSGNASKSIGITTSISPGSIAQADKSRMIHATSVPADIVCTKATGGSCHPKYVYQWQQSPDGINWTDIPGASVQQMQFPQALKRSAFYRRKVTEMVSGEIAYSNTVALYVDTPPAPTN